MKIQNDINNLAPPVAGDTGAPRVPPRDKVGEPSGAPAPQPIDTAETSPVARQREADPARLEQLRTAIQSGTYSVPAGEIAARLIAEHLNKPR